jgi:hypothetical protein
MIELAAGEGFMTVARDNPAAAPVQPKETHLPSPVYDGITAEKPPAEEETQPDAQSG